jgi:hypothetical protein
LASMILPHTRSHPEMPSVIHALVGPSYVGPLAAMRAPLRNCHFSCCAKWHRAHAHVAPSSFEPDLIVSRFSRTMIALL